MADNFGDFQNLVYAEAVKGKSSRYPFDFQSIQRKASEALPETGCIGTCRRRPETDGRNGRTLPRFRATESCPG